MSTQFKVNVVKRKNMKKRNQNKRNHGRFELAEALRRREYTRGQNILKGIEENICVASVRQDRTELYYLICSGRY